jgi:hypothetical protein
MPVTDGPFTSFVVTWATLDEGQGLRAMVSVGDTKNLPALVMILYLSTRRVADLEEPGRGSTTAPVEARAAGAS